MVTVAAIFAPMTDLRAQQLAWLDAITRSTGLTVSEIARRAKLVPSTLTRFHSRDRDGHTLTAKTVKKIEDAVGIPAYDVREVPKQVPQLAEEGAPFVLPEATGDLMLLALQDVVERNNSVDLWRLQTSALRACKYFPGDILLVDRNREAGIDDAVCAQVYDFRRGTAETVFRIYKPPYLLSADMEGEPLKPLVVDNETVSVVGVIVGALHPGR